MERKPRNPLGQDQNEKKGPFPSPRPHTSITAIIQAARHLQPHPSTETAGIHTTDCGRRRSRTSYRVGPARAVLVNPLASEKAADCGLVERRGGILWRLWRCRRDCISASWLHHGMPDFPKDIFTFSVCAVFGCCAFPTCWVMIKARCARFLACPTHLENWGLFSPSCWLQSRCIRCTGCTGRTRCKLGCCRGQYLAANGGEEPGVEVITVQVHSLIPAALGQPSHPESRTKRCGSWLVVCMRSLRR